MTVALLGFGTVGLGVYNILSQTPGITVKYVVDLHRHEELPVHSVTEIEVALQDEEVDTVVEVIGGEHPALEFVRDSLKAGKNVVTANKLLISTHYETLSRLALEKGLTLRYTAAVGGGIPWLVNLRRATRVSEIYEVSGIMNGTSNYILDAMHSESENFEVALRQAQELGYAERDPSADIDGIDTCCKIVLSADLAFSAALDRREVDCAGIREITVQDISACEFEGCVCKLMGFAYFNEGHLSVFVEPTFVPKNSMEASVHKNLNLISFDAQYVGRESFYGFGAGRYPTAYTVVQDCLDISEGKTGLYNESMKKQTIDNSLVSHPYYLRTDAADDFVTRHCRRKCGDGMITDSVSVEEMHAFARRVKENGKTCFFAGMQKDNSEDD